MTRQVADFVKSVALFVVYAVFLLISSIFVLIVFIGEQFLPPRSDHHADRYAGWMPGRAGMIAMDVAAIILAYLAADYARCAFYMHTAWPEQVEGYGSTLGIHLRMLAAVVVVWPIVLSVVGWYRPARRSHSWRIRRTLSSMLIVGLTMSAVALIIQRSLFPRAQIAFVLIALPFATALVRSLTLAVGQLIRLQTARSRSVDWV
ncbi:MAG: hypothetical protein HS101_19410 [Planctomycetia bacterium]|jgi:Ca2+/Na+ antiporter|nr:hypothetical protein [Planctomycetia bacterium]MCC7315605.1 hypothetical protein [Planctomycetota bacterium]